MKRILAIIVTFMLIPVAIYAGWETWIELTDPADDDIIAIQDVSNTINQASGETSYLLLSNFWENYLKIKADLLYEPDQTAASQAEAEAGTESAIRSFSPLRIWQAITSWLSSVDIGGFPSGSIPYADPTGTLQPHPTVDMIELGYSSDGATENHQNAIDALQAGAGETSLSVTAGGESNNEIAVTVTILPAQNYLAEIWLSETDGGTVTTAFDSWTDSDATVHETVTADIKKRVLTGTDGDAVITFGEDAAVTKYLCAEVSGKVSCAECAFSDEASVCTASAYHVLDVSGNFVDNYSTASYVAQKLKGEAGQFGIICANKAKLIKIAGDDGVYHFEVWTEGTANAGATMAATSSQIGGDSDSFTITADGTAVYVLPEWSSDKPEWTTGNVFLHLVKESGPDAYWVADGNQQLYPSGDVNANAYDIWYNGADSSADAVFGLYLE